MVSVTLLGIIVAANHMTPEEHKRIVSAGLNIIKAKNPDLVTAPKQDDLDILLEKMQSATKHVRSLVGPIDDAVRAAGRSHDKKQLFQTIVKFYVEQFGRKDVWSNDEIIFACAMAHASMMIDQIM